MYLRRIIFIYKTTTRHVDQRKNSHQPATKVVRNSAVELITRFHEDNNLDMKEDIAFVTVSLFNDERYLERFSNWLKTAKKMDKPDDFFSYGSCKTYLSHIKEHFRNSFPNAPLFQRPNENWFSKLSNEMLEKVCQILIDDGDPLEPNKAIQLERENFILVMKELLVWHRGRDTQALDMMSVLTTSTQAVGRYLLYFYSMLS